MFNIHALAVPALAALAFMSATAHPTSANAPCRVVDGMIAELALGPYLPASETVTLKATHKVEFRWDISDKESSGWMRISDEAGVELGWVPAGHEAVTCGKAN
jgi:hypothetical protein